MKKFSSLLKFYRERARLTKTEVSKRLGVSAAYLINLENRRDTPPSYERCNQLADILNLSKPEQQEFLMTAFRERTNTDSQKFITALHPDFFKRVEQIIKKHSKIN